MSEFEGKSLDELVEEITKLRQDKVILQHGCRLVIKITAQRCIDINRELFGDGYSYLSEAIRKDFGLCEES